MTPDGAIVACRREPSNHVRVYADGSEVWLHYLGEADSSLTAGEKVDRTLSPEDVEIRDRFYTALLVQLTLNDKHRKILREDRGLTDEAITQAGYGSLPRTMRDFRLNKLVNDFTIAELVRVPGIVITEKPSPNREKYTRREISLSHANGMLIPIRNLAGQILACKVRNDHGDTKYVYLSTGELSAGSHAHVPPLRTSTIRITEGELKADVATHLSNVLTISVPGVSSWRLALPILEELKPTRVLVAFDSDKLTNKHVAVAEGALINALLDARYDVEVETWDAKHKGIDDALFAEALIETRPATAAVVFNEGDDANALIQFVEDNFDLGTYNNEPFLSPKRGSRRALVLADLHDYLADQFHLARGHVPKRDHVNNAISVLMGRAIRLGERWDLPIRVGRAPDGAIVIDLGNRDSADAIIVRPTGWTIERSPIVWRNSYNLPLPIPEPGGSIDELRSVCNVTDATWPLLAVWPIAALIPDIPHPIAFLVGPQGSAKTTTSRFLTNLIDPSEADSRSQVKDPADWAALGIGAYAVNLDNVSSIPAWFSDALCRAVTGDAYTPRAFYTQDQVKVLKFKLAMVMSTIDIGQIRGDLADRMLPITLAPIPDGRRTTLADIKQRYDEMRPRVLGAILDTLVKVLAELPHVHLDSMPRMSDFALVCAAFDKVTGWNTLELYLQTRDDLAAQVVEGDPIAMFVRDLVYDNHGEPKAPWEGTLKDLLALIQRHAETGDLVLRYAIVSERGVSSTLERSTPALAKVGVTVKKERKRAGGRGHTMQTYVTISPGDEPIVVAEKHETDVPY